MKIVTAYVSTHRVHSLVEKLEAAGVQEIMVTEYFSPLSKISRFVFLCGDDSVKEACDIIHRIGTNGSPGDHYIDVKEFHPKSFTSLPLGQGMSALEARSDGVNQADVPLPRQ